MRVKIIKEFKEIVYNKAWKRYSKPYNRIDPIVWEEAFKHINNNNIQFGRRAIGQILDGLESNILPPNYYLNFFPISKS